MSNNIIAATSRTLRTLSDGTVRLLVDFEPVDRSRVMELFGEPGSPLAIARLTQDAAQQGLMEQQTQEYGEQAKALRLSGFFRSPEVWRAIGTDEHFLDWLPTQPCCIPGAALGAHQGDVVACHVRRVADGAGVGIKPGYSAVPMCMAHHRMQHDMGEVKFMGKEFFDRQRIEYLVKWGWGKLKADLDYEHWYQVPPAVLLAWAEKHGVDRYLPEAYRDAQ